MTISKDDLIAIERAVVKGWPALETERIGGWIARWSSGGSVRANSVATTDFDGSLSLDAAIEAVAAFYRRFGGAPKFTISGTSKPDDLDSQLDERGWERTGLHVTMTKSVSSDPVVPSAAVRVEQSESTDADWLNVYLQGLTPDRRGVATRLAQGVPQPRIYFSGKRNGETIACGLSVIEGSLASVQCMATLASVRRSGAATAVLSAIEANARTYGVDRLYLQTDADNFGAIALYQRFGFEIVDRYHTRLLTP